MKQRSVSRTAGLCVLAALTCSLLTGLAVHHADTSIVQAEHALDSTTADLLKIQAAVDETFVGEVDMEAIHDAVLEGYMTGLGDRWSYYMTAEEYEAYQRAHKTNLIGIGITTVYAERDGKHILRIQAVEPDSPAEQAGLGVYDVITAIDGKLVDDMADFDEARDAVLGDEGTQVKLDITKYKTHEAKTYTVTRAEYEQTSVTGRMLADNVGYVRITAFQKKSAEQFHKVLQGLLDDGAESLIFDVRRNNGGLVTSMVDMLDELLPEGDIITLERKDGAKQTFTSDAAEIDVPMAVLMDADSYSAAEFFASALQVYDKAVLVGELTCGKGFAQVPIPLDSGGAIKLSVEKYYTKDGISLIGTGVEPDEKVSLPETVAKHYYAMTDEEDTQLQRALEVLQKDAADKAS